MSFRDLRGSRKTKSYVDAASPQPTDAAVNNEKAPSQTASNGVADVLYHSLPPAAELRTSDISGRGLWAKNHLSPGASFILPPEYNNTLISDRRKEPSYLL